MKTGKNGKFGISQLIVHTTKRNILPPVKGTCHDPYTLDNDDCGYTESNNYSGIDF